jgi:hypothetical protein
MTTLFSSCEEVPPWSEFPAAEEELSVVPEWGYAEAVNSETPTIKKRHKRR